jgi:hypothetical protein
VLCGWVMWEASWSVIDGMMERLGERAGLVVGGQRRWKVRLPEPKGVNSRIPLVVADPSHEADRGVGDGFRSPTIIDVSD